MSPHSLWLLGSLVPTACRDPRGATDAPILPEAGDEVPCTNPIVEAVPADGATRVYERAQIYVELTEADPTATLWVAGDGGLVPGESNVHGTMVTWDGDPLQWNTDYTVTVTHACGAESVRWSTHGEVPIDFDPQGVVFALEPSSGRWVEPPVVGDLLAATLAPLQIFIEVTEIVEPDRIGLLLALGASGAQARCVPTVALPDARWSEPDLWATAPRLVFETREAPFDLGDVSFKGGFSPDGSRIAQGILSGRLDTRALGPALSLGDAPRAACDLFEQLDVACVSCSDGARTCVDLRVEDLAAPWVPSLTLAPQSEDDVLADPACGSDPQPLP